MGKRKIPIIKTYADKDFVERQIFYLKSIRKKKMRERQISLLLQTIAIFSLVLIIVLIDVPIQRGSQETEPSQKVSVVYTLPPETLRYSNGQYVLEGIFVFDSPASEDYITIDYPNTDVEAVGNVLLFKLYYPSQSLIPQTFNVKVLGKEYEMKINRNVMVRLVDLSYPSKVKEGETGLVRAVIESNIETDEINIRVFPPVKFYYFYEHTQGNGKHYYTVYILFKGLLQEAIRVEVIMADLPPVNFLVIPFTEKVNLEAISIITRFGILISGIEETEVILARTPYSSDDVVVMYNPNLLDVEKYKESTNNSITTITYTIKLKKSVEEPTSAQVIFSVKNHTEEVDLLLLPNPEIKPEIVITNNTQYLQVKFRDDVYSAVVNIGNKQFPITTETLLPLPDNITEVEVNMFYGGIRVHTFKLSPRVS